MNFVQSVFSQEKDWQSNFLILTCGLVHAVLHITCFYFSSIDVSAVKMPNFYNNIQKTLFLYQRRDHEFPLNLLRLTCIFYVSRLGFWKWFNVPLFSRRLFKKDHKNINNILYLYLCIWCCNVQFFVDVFISNLLVNVNINKWFWTLFKHLYIEQKKIMSWV